MAHQVIKAIYIIVSLGGLGPRRGYGLAVVRVTTGVTGPHPTPFFQVQVYSGAGFRESS